MQKSLAVVLAASAIFAVLLGGSPAQAQEYPWCAQYGGAGTSGGRNCGFVTHGQCMAAISGNGGFCERNLFYRGPDVRAEERPAPRRPYRRD